MGRGRAKAKQTKVARELKYHSPNTDLAALQRELGGSGKSDRNFDDDYKEYVDDDEDHSDDDPDNWVRPTR
ncbi:MULTISPECIES: DUF3073 domain-containing protein [Micromonospora]|jgi:hypothetical protein|uniref:DUF3073 domain-containing protein n=3 Tax=Micromonospora TaxID=1873 RepID=A0A9W5XK59_9ACTN|nr:MULTISPECIES: DUF3073 domain-containing protein [Micromonospora]MBQ1027443.1 DUF3073 domain-containing protein [Micromonospora sp. C95]MBQ1050942.1 DUF3073 domain-containing protein [Micromonospora sp. C51]MCZ7421568.1 DUF3073 domain-containing protein [Verrucosispora sp. WMMA2121]NEE63664.1 DUF3073 domain-containing protein [Verrucosispora sioxanthis]NGM12774.1 DUF3073 domain-containing protein [Verrucosispora sioxanthis]